MKEDIKEGELKIVTDGKWTLKHTRYRNSLGMLKDMFIMSYIREDGMKINYPFMPPIKINTKELKNIPMDEVNVVDYTDEEMLDFIKKKKLLKEYKNI